MEDKKFSNEELGKIVSRLDIPEDAGELIHFNSCPLCIYANSCPDAGKYSSGREYHIAISVIENHGNETEPNLNGVSCVPLDELL